LVALQWSDQMQPSATVSLASFLDGLSDTLRQAARLAERIPDPEASLPAVLQLRHIAANEDISKPTAWRRAHRGDYGPIISEPGQPIRIARETYLRSLRARPAQGQAAEHVACGPAGRPADVGGTR
jgi:hypothetical protein